jgi:hypothetical protein
LAIGSVLDSKIKRRCHTLTKEKSDSIGARLEHSPRKSLTKEAQQPDVLVYPARTATKLLKLFLYKITQVHLMQPRDPSTRINVCSWFIKSVNEGTLDPHT